MVSCGGCVLRHFGSEHAGKDGVDASEDDVDVDAGTQDIVFGCASVVIVPCHASHTPDGNSFEQEND